MFKKTAGIFAVWVLLLLTSGRPSIAQNPIDQTYTNSFGTLTFSYPAGWVASGQVVTTLVSDPAMLDEAIGGGQSAFSMPTFLNLDTGQAYIRIGPPIDVTRPDIAWSRDTALEDSIDLLIGRERVDDSLERLDEPFLGKPAMQLQTSTERTDVYALAIEIQPDVVVGVSLVTALGDLATYIPTLSAVVESMIYNAPPAPIEMGSVVWQYQAIEEDIDASISFYRFGPVAVGPEGHVHVRGSDYLYTFDETGNYLSEIDLGTQVLADDIAVAQDGTLWYVEETGDGDTPGWVRHFAADGFPIGRFDLGLEIEEAFTDRPQFITLDADGLAYVAFLIEGDEVDETLIRVLSPDSVGLEREFALEGVDEPIQALKMSPNNQLYVLVGGQLRIYDLDGQLVSEPKFVLPSSVTNIAVAPDGKIYLATQWSAIMCFNSAGEYLYQYGRPALASDKTTPLEQGQLGSIQDMAVAPNGDLVVTDYGNGYGRVMQITFSGD